jgi:hypothetical protein
LTPTRIPDEQHQAMRDLVRSCADAIETNYAHELD